MLLVVVMACGAKNSKSAEPDGAKIYKINCVICHGIDGKLGINGAKDLTASPMTLKERIQNITYGAGTMTAYKDILSTEEIEAVAQYTLTLK
jgi:cytochrome c6